MADTAGVESDFDLFDYLLNAPVDAPTPGAARPMRPTPPDPAGGTRPTPGRWNRLQPTLA